MPESYPYLTVNLVTECIELMKLKGVENYE